MIPYKWHRAIPLALILMSQGAFAFDLNIFGSKPYLTENPELQNQARVVQKDGRCSLATVPWPRPGVPKIQVTNFKHYATAFVCIGDIVLNADTLKQKSGCGAFFLDGDNLQTRPFVDRFGYNIIPNKKCADGGFEELMKDQVIGGLTVETMLFRTVDSFAGEAILIYADNPKYVDWYRAAKTRSEMGVKDAFAKEVKRDGFPKSYSGYQDTKGEAIKEIRSADPLLSPTQK